MESTYDYFNAANTEPLVTIQGKTTGTHFALRQYTYGVLVPDPSHPLSCVSVANSSLSIDLWVGCSWQCKYCHVQGTHQDLAHNGTMPKKPIPRSVHTIDNILDKLVKHPFFIPDKTIISIGTASTEPFAPGAVAESTFAIMENFIDRGLKNPFWIVTKGGIPPGRKKDIAKIAQLSKGLMISICWAGNPESIEPINNNRFINAETAKDAGATISWYMRPIVPEWSGNVQKIESMMALAKEKYGSVIDMIVPGGLRWTEGIENGLIEIHKTPLPNIPKDDNVKALPQELVTTITLLAQQYFPGLPVFWKSSCALTHMLKVPSITAVETFAENECKLSICPSTQRKLCMKAADSSHPTTQKAQQVLDSLGIPAIVIAANEKGLITYPDLSCFTYAVKQTVFKHLALEREVHA